MSLFSIGQTLTAEALNAAFALYSPLSAPATALSVASGLVNWNLSTNSVFELALNQNATLQFPINPRPGSFLVYVAQDSTGSRTLTIAPGVGFRAPMGVAPILSSAPGAVDILQCTSGDGVNFDVSIVRSLIGL